LNKVITATALAAALLAGGTATATSLHKDVELRIDGQTEHVSAFALTDSDVLAARGVTLGTKDVVSPALDSTVSDGAVVEVNYNKPVTLNVDGTPVTIETTATTLSTALAQAPVPGLGTAWLSVNRTAPLPRGGLSVVVSTPKQVEFKVAGKSVEVTTTAATVADLLVEQNLSLADTDVIKPEPTTTVAAGQVISIDRVVVKTRTKTAVVRYRTVHRKNTGLWKGETRVLTAGRSGKVKRTYSLTIVNGEVTKKVVIAAKVTRKPVTRVVQVGTKTSSHGAGINLARAAMWDRIARCESGGNWQINSGNGYYGGLQFNRASWNGNGGRDFAAYPHQASRAEQITVANRYYAKAGTSPWTCA